MVSTDKIVRQLRQAGQAFGRGLNLAVTGAVRIGRRSLMVVDIKYRPAILVLIAVIGGGLIFAAGIHAGSTQTKVPAGARGIINKSGARTSANLVQSPVSRQGWAEHGTITAIKNSVISLKTNQGQTETITVTSATRFIVAGKTASLKDIKVGDEIVTNGTSDSQGVLVAALVHKQPPSAAPRKP